MPKIVWLTFLSLVLVLTFNNGYFATHMPCTHWPHSQSEDENTCHTRSSPNRPVGIDLSSYRLPGEECFLLWTVIETKTVKRTMSTSVTSVPNAEPGYRDFVDPWTGQVRSQDGLRAVGVRYQLSRQDRQSRLSVWVQCRLVAKLGTISNDRIQFQSLVPEPLNIRLLGYFWIYETLPLVLILNYKHCIHYLYCV